MSSKATNHAPSRYCAAKASATLSASRVLPLPPAPVSVNSRRSRLPSSWATSRIARSRSPETMSREPEGCRLRLPCTPGRPQCGILSQNQALEVLQGLGRREGQVVAQSSAEFAIDRERIGLPTSAVQRGHQLRSAAALATGPCRPAPRVPDQHTVVSAREL